MSNTFSQKMTTFKIWLFIEAVNKILYFHWVIFGWSRTWIWREGGRERRKLLPCLGAHG
jgi:hypothetical protein